MPQTIATGHIGEPVAPLNFTGSHRPDTAAVGLQHFGNGIHRGQPYRFTAPTGGR